MTKKRDTTIGERLQQVSGVKVKNTVKMKAVVPATGMHPHDQNTVDTQQLMKVYNGIKPKTMQEKLEILLHYIPYVIIVSVVLAALAALVYYLLF